MSRTRRSGPAALLVAMAFVLVLASFAAAAPRRLGSRSWSSLAAVPWPVSSVVVSEVQTGGASASDEFAELYNAGPLAADLAGLELVYVTSTGSTVTRKAIWSTSTILEPGRHLLVANSAGIYAASADLVYSGGFAATGGAVALRLVGGAAIDAVGWGDATNTFVEGSPVAAPAAGSSIERNPGGSAGNGIDTNDNAADFGVANPPTPSPCGSDCPTTPPPSPIEHTIADIQGTGSASPLVNQTVITQGVVTAAYPTGGFFGYVLQTDGTGSGDDATPGASDAVFVHQPSGPIGVQVGDYVQVTGEVSEFGGLTELSVDAADIIDAATDGMEPHWNEHMDRLTAYLAGDKA